MPLGCLSKVAISTSRTPPKRFEAGEIQGYLSIITVAELAAGQMRQENEEAKVQHLLALFTHIDLDFAIAWRGG
jgi:predicted nucleic acid-binding protein